MPFTPLLSLFPFPAREYHNWKYYHYFLSVLTKK
jgi:hypothetical protein